MKRLFKRRRFWKGRKKDAYRPGWRFPMIVEHEIQKWIISPSLHVCSGQSALGDVRLDLHERADVKADMGYLPFIPGSFASVIWDAPYEGSSMWKTMPTLVQLRDVLGIGGRLISLHYLDPSNYLKRTMKLIWKAYFEPKEFRGVRVLVILEKLAHPRIPPRRFEKLVPVPIEIWEPRNAVLEVSSTSCHG